MMTKIYALLEKLNTSVYTTYSASFLTHISNSVMCLPINHEIFEKYGAAVLSRIKANILASSTLYTFNVKVRTAIRTIDSGWLKNLMASVYRGKSFVCYKGVNFVEKIKLYWE